MALKIPGGDSNLANTVIAKATATFASMGFDNTNIITIFEVSSTGLKSWVPGRSVNAITGTTEGKAYYFLAKVDIDISEDFETDGGGTGGGGGGSTPAFTALAGTAWDGSNRYKTISADTELTLAGDNVAGILAITQGTGGDHALSINGNPLDINTDEDSITLIGMLKVNGQFILTIDLGAFVPEEVIAEEDLTFTSRSGSITESPAGTFTGATSAAMVSDQTITGDGYIVQDVTAGDMEICAFGFDTNAVLNSFSNWRQFFYMNTGKYWLGGTVDYPSGHDTGVNYATGDKVRLRRVGTSITFERSTNAGASWTTIQTFPTAQAGTLNIKASWAAGSLLVNPKGLGV